MSRRTRRLAALVRVAELQEAVAKGNAAKALLATRAAELTALEQLEQLRATRLAGGTRAALTGSAQAQAARAGAVVDAQGVAAQAAAEQQHAIDAWTMARRRRRLLDELAVRTQSEVDAQRERAEQVQADELAASRAARR